MPGGDKNRKQAIIVVRLKLDRTSTGDMSVDGSANVIPQRNVLIPIDASPNCEMAFNWYLENLKNDNDLVYFIHVIEPVYSSPAIGLAMESPPIMVDDMTRVMEESIMLGKKLGQKYMKLAKSANLSYKAFLHIDTKPGSAIVRSAAEHKAQLIVIGSRGFGAIRRTLLGSVSDYVVHNSNVPIAVVPPKPKQRP
ncbi:unnamed protein product [Hydatigera taeniaeformis]|uniref:Usp domain-containing protein n=1 Tax=Hydatigena taeniaeformis TaxID=6205 RepID=A0A0R3X6A3_HYDTA|nr:unnamed protein product [Hydatigera taeniaeformis]